MRYGRDDSRRTTGTSFLKTVEFLLGNGAAFHLHAQVFSNLHQALVGDGGEDGGRLRSYIGVVLDAEEVGRSTFIDIPLLLCIKVEFRSIAFLVCPSVSSQGCSVISAHLVHSRSQRCSTVSITYDDIGIGRESTFEIRPDRTDEYQETIFLGRTDTYLSRSADQQRADVQRCSTLIGRDIRLVETDHFLDHLDEQLRGNFRHDNATAGTLQAGSILLHTEDTYLSIGTPVSLQALESLLSVVKAGCSHMEFQVFIRTDFHFSPLPVTVITAHVVISWLIAKCQV